MEQTTYDVTALGELLVDFVQDGESGRKGTWFRMHAGGAPANVAAAVARLGGTSAFVGCVGDDFFGTELRDMLAGRGVDTTGLQVTGECGTTLAFVRISGDGERSFRFYRDPGADTRLRWDERIARLVRRCRVFHFGSLSLTHEPSRSTTFRAVRAARESRSVVSFDPNWRPVLWNDHGEARSLFLAAMELADVVKVSEEELDFLTGSEGDVETRARELQSRSGVPLLLVTLGKRGCHYRYGALGGEVAAFPARTVDTTGAGDAFLGAFLYQLTLRNAERPACGLPDGLEEGELLEMLRFACAAAALSTERSGAMDALPEIHEVLGLMRGNN